MTWLAKAKLGQLTTASWSLYALYALSKRQGCKVVSQSPSEQQARNLLAPCTPWKMGWKRTTRESRWLARTCVLEMKDLYSYWMYLGNAKPYVPTYLCSFIFRWSLACKFIWQTAAISSGDYEDAQVLQCPRWRKLLRNDHMRDWCSCQAACMEKWCRLQHTKDGAC